MSADSSAGPIRSGPAVYFDGKTSTRHQVTLELEPASLAVRGEDGALLARFGYDEMEQSSTAGDVFRIGRAHARGTFERVEVRDPALAAAIDEMSLPVDRTGARAQRSRRKVVVWSVIAVLSLIAVGIFGVPAVATRLAPYVPYSVEQKFGEAINEQIRELLNPGQQGKSFDCGVEAGEKPGQAAMDRMMGRFEAAAALPLPLKLKVVRRKDANAVALPGGYIYVFEGLITKAESPDEVAGVIAHEIGHVAHRDGMRHVLQAAGLSFVFGMVLGDFVGGGAVILAARSLLRLAYSREAEAAADGYSVQLMQKVGGDAHALGRILTRIAGTKEPDVKILLDHPATKERADWVEAAARGLAGGPILDAGEWAALRRICSGP